MRWTGQDAREEGVHGEPGVPPLLGAAADPFFAALVDLLLPERHRLLERVDRLLHAARAAGAVRRRDGDRHASPISSRPTRWWIATAQSSCPSSARRRARPSSPRPSRRTPRTRGSGPRGRATDARRADEGRDRAGLRIATPRRRRRRGRAAPSVTRNAPPETGGISATSSPSSELAVFGRVLAVDRVSRPGGSSPRPSAPRRPLHGRAVDLEASFRPAGALAQTGEQPHLDPHIRTVR